jgi:hypothetical protein
MIDCVLIWNNPSNIRKANLCHIESEAHQQIKAES